MTDGPVESGAKHKSVRQLGKFIAVGGSATLLQYLILIVSVDVIGIPAVIASVLAYVASAVYNYLASYYFTFRSVLDHRRAALKFLAMISIGLAINTALFAFSYKILAINYLVSQVLASATVFLFNFFASKHWTFVETGKASLEEQGR